MGLEQLTILFVEDDPVFRKIVATFLGNKGAKIIEASDGEQGLLCLQEQRFDMVIADLSMPKLGGLGMLKAMADLAPGIPSIVISGNQVMADVVEALRLGANDYLVKPISDLSMIENAIHECMNSTMAPSIHLEELESLSYHELNENLAIIEQNTEAAKHVQQQLFPPSRIEYLKSSIDYSLFHNDEVSAHFIDSAKIDNNHIMMYMAHFYPHDNRAAFASVLLKSFVNHKLKRYRSGESTMIKEPFNMLHYLNERMVKSGLDIFVDIAYVVVELSKYRTAIAQSGSEFRCYLKNEDGMTPLALAESMQLGLAEWTKPSVQFRTLQSGEALCITSNIPQHKALLQNDEYYGLVYDIDTPQGGYLRFKVEQ